MPAQQTWTQYQFERLALDHVAPLLKRLGFRKRGLIWHTRWLGTPTLWGVVQLEKHTENTLHSIRFTVNLGVRTTSEPWTNRWWPGITNCDERIRIGELVGQDPDLWWHIVPATTAPRSGIRFVDPQTPEFLSVLEHVGVKWVKDRLLAHAKASA